MHPCLRNDILLFVEWDVRIHVRRWSLTDHWSITLWQVLNPFHRKPLPQSSPTGLILRTLCPFNVFILLNGWICLYSALDWAGSLRFQNALKIIAISFHFINWLTLLLGCRFCHLASGWAVCVVDWWVTMNADWQVNIKVENRTALQVAAHEGHQRTVMLLLDAGADAKIQDEDGDDAYHYATIGFVSRQF